MHKGTPEVKFMKKISQPFEIKIKTQQGDEQSQIHFSNVQAKIKNWETHVKGIKIGIKMRTESKSRVLLL